MIVRFAALPMSGRSRIAREDLSRGRAAVDWDLFGLPAWGGQMYARESVGRSFPDNRADAADAGRLGIAVWLSSAPCVAKHLQKSPSSPCAGDLFPLKKLIFH